MSGGRLHPDDVHAIARTVVELLREEPPTRTPRLLDASQVADMLGLSRDAVYARADELGAVRLGDGPKARLRFDPAKVAAALDAFDGSKRSERPTPAPQRASRRRTSGATAGGNQQVPELLPIRGVGGAL
jgi:hypothetical protein